MSDFASYAEGRRAKAEQLRPPVWKGPSVDGITYSMLSRFLVCRERFRIAVIEGLRPVREFNHRIEYGHLFHTADEAHSGGKVWQHAVDEYREGLKKKYPMSLQDILHWSNVCRVQFAEYLDYWERTEKAEGLTSEGEERVFDLPYTLPSGRVIRLRGKMDGVARKGKAWTLRETKTKGDVHVPTLMRQLTFDLQCMLYLTVLCEEEKIAGPVRVVYNVVRRPLSGGAGSIRQHKATKSKPAETSAQFYARLGEVIREKPEEFFSRFAVGVQQADIKRFRETCLDPLLENVCNWYTWVTSTQGLADELWPTLANHGQHWRHPFGCANILDEGGSSDLDAYLESGSTVGLERVERLFEEL